MLYNKQRYTINNLFLRIYLYLVKKKNKNTLISTCLFKFFWNFYGFLSTSYFFCAVTYLAFMLFPAVLLELTRSSLIGHHTEFLCVPKLVFLLLFSLHVLFTFLQEICYFFLTGHTLLGQRLSWKRERAALGQKCTLSCAM